MGRPRKRHRAIARLPPSGLRDCGFDTPRYRRRASPRKPRERRVVTAAVGIKRLGLAVLALAVIGVGALVILPFLMPADAVREAVQAEIRAVTGLDPVLRGGASVSLFPTGTVSFDDVSLGDSRTGAPALTAERVVGGF